MNRHAAHPEPRTTTLGFSPCLVAPSPGYFCSSLSDSDSSMALSAFAL
uniref:Uncharacterized protein n=1 Tax=Rhizophora mucronata TaxID=61149 RepID=A0A2P2QAQ6_RHIMU